MSHLTSQEAHDLGVVLEVNRQLLHPRGLALEYTSVSTPHVQIDLRDDWIDAFVTTLKAVERESPEWKESVRKVFEMIAEARDGASSLARFRIQDHRSDPEGVYFDDIDERDLAKAEAFEGLSKTAGRNEALGYFVQPLKVASTE